VSGFALEGLITSVVTPFQRFICSVFLFPSLSLLRRRRLVRGALRAAQSCNQYHDVSRFALNSFITSVVTPFQRFICSVFLFPSLFRLRRCCLVRAALRAGALYRQPRLRAPRLARSARRSSHHALRRVDPTSGAAAHRTVKAHHP